MFINRSKNKSGTVSVRVLQKRGRNNVLVKSFGSSRDEKEIEMIVEEARIYIQQQTATYTKPGHTKSSKHMLRMDPEQHELYQLVNDWVTRDLGNA